MDAAAKALEVSELPAARGCTYIVPRQQFATALVCGGGAGMGSGDIRMALSLGATAEELDLLREKVLAALIPGPKDPAELKQELGSAVRNFGEEGKKKGMTTSLPIILGALQSKGKIVRRPASGRLDEQRYAYELWTNNPPQTDGISPDEALKSMAALFFKWIGPATLGELGVFATLSGKGAKAATANLDLVPLPQDPELLILREELAEFEAFEAPEAPSYRLLSCLDTAILTHTDYSRLFTPEAYQRCLSFQGKDRVVGILKELGYNAIMDRGTVIGLWEYDSANKEIVRLTFEPETPALREEISRTRTFIADQLGDARTFSLDSPKSRQPKLDRLRAG
jgi:hypothetical protein